VYRAVNTLHLGYENQILISRKAKFAVFFPRLEIHTNTQIHCDHKV